jgi:DNA-binding beta-propeller fold protein YncE
VNNRFAGSILVAALSATAALVGAPAATAAAPPTPRIVAHFDIAAGQTPENLAIAPDGSAIVSFAGANQVARVTRNGAVHVLAQLPPGGKCGGFPVPGTLGLARTHDGTVYVAECSGNANTGVWRIRPGAAPVQVAQLPADGMPNGMALDDHTGNLYVTDALRGEVWRVPTRGGAPTVWATGPALREDTAAGANGVTLHNGALWVGNLDQGLIVRIPIRRDGTAAPVRTVVTGLNGVDDFSVIGRDNTIVAALVFTNQVVAVRPGGQPRVLLSAADGLSNPTSVRFRHDTLYVTSAAYYTATPDPNLLVTRFRR